MTWRRFPPSTLAVRRFSTGFYSNASANFREPRTEEAAWSRLASDVCGGIDVYLFVVNAGLWKNAGKSLGRQSRRTNRGPPIARGPTCSAARFRWTSSSARPAKVASRSSLSSPTSAAFAATSPPPARPPICPGAPQAEAHPTGKAPSCAAKRSKSPSAPKLGANAPVRSTRHRLSRTPPPHPSCLPQTPHPGPLARAHLPSEPPPYPPTPASFTYALPSDRRRPARYHCIDRCAVRAWWTNQSSGHQRRRCCNVRICCDELRQRSAPGLELRSSLVPGYGTAIARWMTNENFSQHIAPDPARDCYTGT